MAEYYSPFPDIPNYKVPRLHRVLTSTRFLEVYSWLRDNTQGAFYTLDKSSYDFSTNKVVTWLQVEFEEPEDAVLFSISFPIL